MTSDEYTLEDYEIEFYDDIYIEYMESGAYYDTDFEDFTETKYNEYLKSQHSTSGSATDL